MRTTSTKKYAAALILTLVVFSVGILIGINLEDARLADAKQITVNEKLNLLSLQLQQKYIESGADCKSLNKLLENNIDDLAKKGATIIKYQKNSVFSTDEFNAQLRDYFLTEIQFYLISKEIDTKCGNQNVKVIYFYNENENDTQGVILDYLKKQFKEEVFIFSFNSQFTDEPMVAILLESYSIKEFPSVVVDEKVFQGHSDVRTLKDEICKKLDGKHEEC